MAENKRPKRKPHKPKPFISEHIDGLTPDLQELLWVKLTKPQLMELERQLRSITHKVARKAEYDTHMVTWATLLRVLHDRFGFEHDDMQNLYDWSAEYLQDIADKRITIQEMLDTLEHQDGITLSWEGEE